MGLVYCWAILLVSSSKAFSIQTLEHSLPISAKVLKCTDVHHRSSKKKKPSNVLPASSVHYSTDQCAVPSLLNIKVFFLPYFPVTH